MGYKIRFSPRAQKEIEDAIDYYAIRTPMHHGISFQLSMKRILFYL
jgi:hypothetical protein